VLSATTKVWCRPLRTLASCVAAAGSAGARGCCCWFVFCSAGGGGGRERRRWEEVEEDQGGRGGGQWGAPDRGAPRPSRGAGPGARASLLEQRVNSRRPSRRASGEALVLRREKEHGGAARRERERSRWPPPLPPSLYGSAARGPLCAGLARVGHARRVPSECRASASGDGVERGGGRGSITAMGRACLLRVSWGGVWGRSEKREMCRACRDGMLRKQGERTVCGDAGEGQGSGACRAGLRQDGGRRRRGGGAVAAAAAAALPPSPPSAYPRACLALHNHTDTQGGGGGGGDDHAAALRKERGFQEDTPTDPAVGRRPPPALVKRARPTTTPSPYPLTESPPPPTSWPCKAPRSSSAAPLGTSPPLPRPSRAPSPPPQTLSSAG
jgi:hypothetical protein